MGGTLYWWMHLHSLKLKWQRPVISPMNFQSKWQKNLRSFRNQKQQNSNKACWLMRIVISTFTQRYGGWMVHTLESGQSKWWDYRVQLYGKASCQCWKASNWTTMATTTTTPLKKKKTMHDDITPPPPHVCIWHEPFDHTISFSYITHHPSLLLSQHTYQHTQSSSSFNKYNHSFRTKSLSLCITMSPLDYNLALTTTAAVSSSLAQFRTWRLRILPVLFFGIWGTKRIPPLSRLWLATWDATWSMIFWASWSSCFTPRWSAMYALGCSVASSALLTPITQASATSGIVSNNASSSTDDGWDSWCLDPNDVDFYLLVPLGILCTLSIPWFDPW